MLQNTKTVQVIFLRPCTNIQHFQLACRDINLERQQTINRKQAVELLYSRIIPYVRLCPFLTICWALYPWLRFFTLNLCLLQTFKTVKAIFTEVDT